MAMISIKLSNDISNVSFMHTLLLKDDFVIGTPRADLTHCCNKKNLPSPLCIKLHLGYKLNCDDLNDKCVQKNNNVFSAETKRGALGTVFNHKWCSKFCQRRIVFLNELKQLMAQE